MSSYPPGGDYDERLLNNAPKATKAELQEGYNVNLLASDSSETPMTSRPQPTVDEHNLETGTPPNKEAPSTSYSSPWYHQKKWRIFMLIAGIIVIGAIVGGVAGGVVAHNNSKNNKSNGPGPSATVSVASSISVDTSIVAPAQPTDGPLLSTSSSPSAQSSTGAAAVPNGTGRPPQAGSDNLN